MFEQYMWYGSELKGGNIIYVTIESFGSSTQLCQVFRHKPWRWWISLPYAPWCVHLKLSLMVRWHVSAVFQTLCLAVGSGLVGSFAYRKVSPRHLVPPEGTLKIFKCLPHCSSAYVRNAFMTSSSSPFLCVRRPPWPCSPPRTRFSAPSPDPAPPGVTHCPAHAVLPGPWNPLHWGRLWLHFIGQPSFYWGMMDIQRNYIIFSCTTSWIDVGVYCKMITTVSPLTPTTIRVFLILRTLKTYSLSYFAYAVQYY